jgi:nucleotide-binding universal stress UspA family protein
MKLLEKILVPVSLEAHRNPHLKTAVTLAETFKSQLIFIHVLPKEAKLESVNAYVSRQVENDLDQVLKDLVLEDGAMKRIIEYGNTFERIISVADNENVNLILFSNFIEQQNNHFSMDVVAEKLVRKSDKPVWIVKEGGREFPDTILCTVDYSEASRRALHNAIKIARTFKKQLFILNVLQPVERNFSPRYSIDVKWENEKLNRENQRLFDNFLAEFNFTDVEYTTKVVTGVPENEILSFVSRMDIDLLFMGATGKTFLQRVLLGSVTENLIRELPSSMVVTKSESILNLKIDADISELEKHLSNARRLEATGYYEEAIHQLKLSLQINDLHIPALSAISKLYRKIGEEEMAESYSQKIDVILRRLWDKKTEFEIRKQLEL